MSRFASEWATKWTLNSVDFRVPQPKELYIGKDKRVHRCSEERISNRSQKHIIIRESWLELEN